MNGAKYIVGSLAVGLILIAGLIALSLNRPHSHWGKSSLVLYCAAGLKDPVEAAVHQYEKEYGVRVQINYGGSGTLLSSLQVAAVGDLYLAADESYIHRAQERDLVAESILLATMEPVLAVAKGNPRQIESVSDLLREDVRVALANPEAAAVGQITRQILEENGIWEEIKSRATVFKPTVNDIANDVTIGSVDVGIVWDSVAAQYPNLETVRSPLLSKGIQNVSIGVLTACRQPAAALRFARYLGARDKGLVQFGRFGLHPVEGDVWAEMPRVVLYSGGVNRLAIEDTIRNFQEREGVVVETIYNGCGILVGQMKLGERPDAYFSCDVSFMSQVADLFFDPIDVSETDMVIVTQKGNPKNLLSLQDLTAPGLRLGLANAEQSALGALTKRLLEEEGMFEAVMQNVKSQTPTADLLVNQIRTGSLDAVVVYRANTPYVRGELDIVPIDRPAARAVQPYAVGKNTLYPQLMARLMVAICSKSSQEKFESIGFHWLAGETHP